jgi:hypothetical protein
MDTLRYLPEDKLIEEALQALFNALGPVETARFLNIPRQKRLESVAQHRQWQDALDPEAFLDRVFGATDK